MTEKCPLLRPLNSPYPELIHKNDNNSSNWLGSVYVYFRSWCTTVRFHAACKLRWTLRSLAILNCNYTLTLEQIYSSTGLSHDSSRYMYHFSIQCSQLENHKQGPTLTMPARYRTQGLAHNSVIGVPASTRYETLPSPTQSWRQGEDCSQHKHEPSHMMPGNYTTQVPVHVSVIRVSMNTGRVTRPRVDANEKTVHNTNIHHS